jgi:uncharacterized membrane protein YkvA (DUF1232 family)
VTTSESPRRKLDAIAFPMLERARAWAAAMRRETVAVYLAIRDPRTPWIAKLVGGLVVAYAASPVDLIPDFVPVLGILDDLLIVPAGLWLTVRLIPHEILEQARARADVELQRPKSLVAGFFVVAVWVGAVLLAIALVRSALK